MWGRSASVSRFIEMATPVTKRRAAAAVAVALVLGGCLPVLVGGLILKSTSSKGQKQEFMNQLQRTNFDRESKGLPALEWCSEAYRFDKGWASEDANCAARIKAYEAGDAKALNPRVMPAKGDSVTHTARSDTTRSPDAFPPVSELGHFRGLENQPRLPVPARVISRR